MIWDLDVCATYKDRVGLTPIQTAASIGEAGTAELGYKLGKRIWLCFGNADDFVTEFTRGSRYAKTVMAVGDEG